MRRSVLVILSAGVVSCTLVSGASDLVVEGPERVPAQPSIEAGTDGSAVADARADGPGIDAATLASGTVDTTFGSGGRVLVDFGAVEVGRSLSVAADGSILVGGRTGTGISTEYALARLAASGALDAAFGTGGKLTIDFASDFDEVAEVAHTADGHIVAAGRSWNTATGGFVTSAARLDADGALDPTFASAGKLQFGPGNGNNQDGTFAMLLRPGDAPVTTGSENGNLVASAFLANGQADPSVAKGTGRVVGLPGAARCIAHQLDGKLVLAGWTPPYAEATSSDVIVERRLADLSSDATFGTNGRIVVDVGILDHASAVAVAPDGKIVVAGDTTTDSASGAQLMVLRFGPTGAPDTTFGQNGRVVMRVRAGSVDKAHALAFDASGRLLVAGSTTGPLDVDVMLVRFAANGTLDTTFGDQGLVSPSATGTEDVREIAFTADGRIVLVGTASNGTDTDILVQRFLP